MTIKQGVTHVKFDHNEHVFDEQSNDVGTGGDDEHTPPKQNCDELSVMDEDIDQEEIDDPPAAENCNTENESISEKKNAQYGFCLVAKKSEWRVSEKKNIICESIPPPMINGWPLNTMHEKMPPSPLSLHS